MDGTCSCTSLGAVIFLGNIIVTGAWMLMAERTRSPGVIHFSAKAVIRADFLFTLPGVLLVLLNGLFMASAGWGEVFHDVSWISVALALFTMSGIIWVGALLRLQHRMAVLSARPGDADSLSPQFYSALYKWYFRLVWCRDRTSTFMLTDQINAPTF